MNIDNEIFTKEELENMARNMLEENPDDFTELDDFIEVHADDYPADLAEYVFRLAVQSGNIEYVEEHIEDFELNDDGGSSSYLEETEDEDMIELLMDNGAFYSTDHYSDYKFAVETVNGSIVAFAEAFQREVFEKYKETFGLEDNDIRNIIDGDEDDESEYDEIDRDVEEDMQVLGVSFEDDEVTFIDKTDMDNGDDDGYDLKELIEELGWDCEFEGDDWKLETTGVYFVE